MSVGSKDRPSLKTVWDGYGVSNSSLKPVVTYVTGRPTSKVSSGSQANYLAEDSDKECYSPCCEFQGTPSASPKKAMTAGCPYPTHGHVDQSPKGQGERRDDLCELLSRLRGDIRDLIKLIL